MRAWQAALNQFLWCIGFGTAGLLGLIETIYSLAANRANAGPSRLIQVARWGVAAIYVLIIVIASFPELVPSLSIPLKAIEAEGIMVALLLFFGMNFAWMLFAEPLYEAPNA